MISEVVKAIKRVWIKYKLYLNNKETINSATILSDGRLLISQPV